MRTSAGKVQLSRHLAKRLFPLTLLIGLLISIGYPVTYIVLETQHLQRTATSYAQEFARQLQRLILETPGLWKYHAPKYIQVLQEFLPDKDVTTIQVLDEAGQRIGAYEHATPQAAAWWNRYVPEGTAPILFNNHQIGTVRVGISRGAQLSTTLLLFFLSSILGVSLAALVYHFPIRVVTGMEGEIQDLMDAIQRANAELEDRVEERTQDLQIATDQLREALRAAREASRVKAEFLTNMSHELRTPLNAVLGFSEVLQQESSGPLSQLQARYLGHIRREGKHLLDLISLILEFRDVGEPGLTLQLHSLSVAEILEGVLDVTRELASRKRQTIAVDLAPDLPPLMADPVLVKRVLFNLLSNAVKFTPSGGQITVTARRIPGIADLRLQISDCPDKSQIANRKSEIGDFLEIAVTDTGIGIKAEDLPRLFQEFVQLENATTKHHEGTGLGLALTRRLVELHAGTITASSAGEGHGSTFTVRLPFASPTA